MKSTAPRLSLGLALAFAAACGGGGGGDSEGVVFGSLEDGDSGSVVVVGDSSTTLFADEHGRFTVDRVPASGLRIRVLTPGRLSRILTVRPGDSVEVSQDEDPDPDLAPAVAVTSLTPAADGIEVRASVTANSPVVDARAEILGTDDGVVLAPWIGNLYRGFIRTSHVAGANVMVFAVDDLGRHGQDIGTAAGADKDGSWTGGDEHWAGSFFGRHNGDLNHGRYRFNASLAVTADGAASGFSAHVRLWRLEAGQSPLVTVSVTGTARVVGKNYRMELADADGDVSITMMGTVSDDGGFYSGTATGKVAGVPYQSTFALVNTNVRPNPWSAEALAQTWGLSFHYRNEPAMALARYQYNVLVPVDAAGAVAADQPCTLGSRTAAGASLAFTDVNAENVGYFTGAPGLALDSGASYDLYGFMGVGTRHVHGVWASQGPSYGTFWGRKNPSWAPAHFDAQWQGTFVVTSGPDAGQALNAQVRLDASGMSLGGSINGAITGGNVAIGDGALSFVDASVGAFTGSFAGTQEGSPVTVNMSVPELPESASMGVYHGRLVGKFSLSTNGDAGYYFLHRNSNN